MACTHACMAQVVTVYGTSHDCVWHKSQTPVHHSILYAGTLVSAYGTTNKQPCVKHHCARSCRFSVSKDAAPALSALMVHNDLTTAVATCCNAHHLSCLACCLVFAACCLVFAACCLVFAACCLVFVASEISLIFHADHRRGHGASADQLLAICIGGRVLCQHRVRVHHRL